MRRTYGFLRILERHPRLWAKIFRVRGDLLTAVMAVAWAAIFVVACTEPVGREATREEMVLLGKKGT